MLETNSSLASVVVDPRELVSDQLLNDVHGEVLLIRSNQVTTICKRSANDMRQQAFSWLHMAGTDKNASFIAGRVSDKGGRFQIVSRDQAVELIALWIFEELQHGINSQ